MEENVALDTTKQKKFDKSIKGLKKLIKKNENEKSEEDVILKRNNRKDRRKRPERGLVYLSHIPHGFYEHEMNQYFKQFGVVTNVRVIRSKRTGNSKGFAFVEFKNTAVAEIVAETMNNYLMGKRLIKAAYVPPEKQRPKAMRKHWSRLNNPGRDAQLKNKKAYNENKDDVGELKRARKILSNINKTKKKLSELGINYDFFTPVDVPEALQNSLITTDKEETEITLKNEKQPKKDKKVQNVEIKDTKQSKQKDKSTKEEVIKTEKNKKAKKSEIKSEISVKAEQKKTDKKEKKKIKEDEPVVNKKEQKKKLKTLKNAGVNPPENFIKVQEDAEDSDSSFEFDSDQYEQMLEDEESDIGSNDESDNEDENENNEEGESDTEDDVVTPTAKKSEGKPKQIIEQPQKQAKKQKTIQVPEQVKRKAPHKPPVAAKKPKFEKQKQQPIKKQLKKKK